MSDDNNDILNNLTSQLANETKLNQVKSILSSYSQIDRKNLVSRSTIVQQELGNVVGSSEGILLCDLLSNFVNDISSTFEEVTNSEHRMILQNLHSEFGPFFVGFSSSLMDDWIRANWFMKKDAYSDEPIMSMRIFKRDFSDVVIESYMSSWIFLVQYIVEQLSLATENTRIAGNPDFFEKLTNIKENLDKLQENLTPKK